MGRAGAKLVVVTPPVQALRDRSCFYFGSVISLT